jgi:orotate phosphoribosyltransferase
MTDTSLVTTLGGRRGHFRLESGHHGDLWLDLELMCLDPRRLQRYADELATRLAVYSVEAVCSPLVEGAFVGAMVAARLGVRFSYSERFERSDAGDGLFPVDYRIPNALRDSVRAKPIAIVNDVTNAGSAVRGTCADLRSCGAQPIVLGSLVVLGSAAARYASDQGMALETLAALPNTLWTPEACPLCASGIPLEDPAQ